MKLRRRECICYNWGQKRRVQQWKSTFCTQF